MRGLRLLVVGLAALAIATAGLWLGMTASTPFRPTGETPSASAPTNAKAAEDLMMDLEVTPLDPQTPPPLAVTGLDGARVTLADVKGHVVLVYFWATW